MAILVTPTLEHLCRTALRKAGQVSPSTGMIQEAVSDQFMQVMNDIKLKAPQHPLLETTELKVTAVGVRSLSQPTKAHTTKSVLLFDGNTDWRGTAQTGASTTITLAAAFSEDSNNIIGLQIVTLGGTGSLQTRYITAYDNSTKIATVDSAWTTTPDSTTTYLIVNYQNEIYSTSKQVMNYDSYKFASKGLPLMGAIEGETLWLDKPPDKIYPLYWTYYQDVDQIDWSSALALKILREWRTIIVEGVSAYSMDIYDDARSTNEFQKYFIKLGLLVNETLDAVQTEPYDS